MRESAILLRHVDIEVDAMIALEGARLVIGSTGVSGTWINAIL